jgi:hypothetical protein
LPIVSEVVVILALPHAREVREPQAPDSSCRRICAGADETVMVCEEDTATKLYHTSNLSAAPHPIAEIVDGFQVAFTFVPVVLAQVVEDVNATALEHSSLAGD